jgi:hypothetical protein
MLVASLVPVLFCRRRLPADERLQVGVPEPVAAAVAGLAAEQNTSISQAAALVLVVGLLVLGVVDDFESILRVD